MKFQRVIPPVAACPLSFRQLLRGLSALLGGAGHLARRRHEFESYLGVERVYLTSSGKTALYLAIQALRQMRQGTDVIVPAYTCFSVPSAVVKAGLHVVPCDVDPDTFDFNYDCLEKAITDRTLCIIATHLFGIPADIAKIREIAARRSIYVIEDAAQGLGAVDHDKQLGTSGDVGIYSLGRGKHLTCGSGGMVVTGNPKLATVLETRYNALPEPTWGESFREWCEVALMQLFLRPWLYWIPAGLPFLKLGHTVFDRDFVPKKLSNMKAGLLEGWQDNLERGNAVRRRNVETIAHALNDRLPARPDLPLLRVPVLFGSPSERQRLWDRGRTLGVAKLYPTGIHMIPDLAGPHVPEAYPGATQIAERLLTLPTHHLLTKHDLATLIDIVNGTMHSADTIKRETVSETSSSRKQTA